jgi:membrane protein YqaA with SNARE-associated domain
MFDKGKAIIGILFVIALFVGAIYLSSYIQGNDNAKEIVSSFGYLGMLIISFVGGLNLFVPIPPTASIPIFYSAGFNLSAIVAVIVIGTTIADLVSYYIGTFFRPQAEKSKNKVLKFVRKHCENKPKMIYIIVFLYSAFIPFPNEAVLLPLGTLGVKLKHILLPFVLGTLLHVSAIAYGLTFLIPLS